MKIDLIGMILNESRATTFDQIIIDDDGRPLDAIHSLDKMIMEYAKVRNGGASDIVAAPRSIMNEVRPAPPDVLIIPAPQTDEQRAALIEEFSRCANHRGLLEVGDDPVVTAAARDVLAERRRQIEAEGYTPSHDDSHTAGELALAAALYAIPYENLRIKQDDYIGLHLALDVLAGWNHFKPEKGRRRRLVKAGALIQAEIERLDRAAVASTTKAEG